MVPESESNDSIVSVHKEVVGEWRTVTPEKSRSVRILCHYLLLEVVAESAPLHRSHGRLGFNPKLQTNTDDVITEGPGGLVDKRILPYVPSVLRRSSP